MNKIILLGVIFLLFLLMIVTPANAEIISNKAPSISESKDFQAWVNGNEMFTGQAGNNYWGYSFCTFDFNEPVTICVKVLWAIKWLDILPAILKIQHKTIDDYTFEFILENPKVLLFFRITIKIMHSIF